MNSNPVPRNEAHGAALENYRVAQVTLDRFANHQNATNGRDTAYLETHSPEYVTLVQARDVARAAVEQANPAGAGDAVEEANPAGKPPKKGEK